MRQWMAADDAGQLESIMERGGKMDHTLADAVAQALKSWALSYGVTHYTHWFHPLRGTTAEKHDTFLN